MRNFNQWAAGLLFLVLVACSQEQEIEPPFLEVMEKAEL
jgi:hypothetical protein